MSKLKMCMTFLGGAAVGSVITGVILKKVYDKMLEERVASVEEVFGRHPREEFVGEDLSVEDDPDIEVPNMSTQEFREANRAYRKQIEEKGYTDYSAMHEKPTESPSGPVQVNGEEEREVQDKPYVISPNEFGEYSEYNTISLVCFADGVITDRDFELLENPEEYIGRDACKHFGDYEDDAVHIRNDAKMCDYEILRDTRLYVEAVSQEPPPIRL